MSSRSRRMETGAPSRPDDDEVLRGLAEHPDAGVVHAMVALYASEQDRQPLASVRGVVLSFICTGDDDRDRIETSIFPTDRPYRAGEIVTLDWDVGRRLKRVWWEPLGGDGRKPTAWDDAAWFIGDVIAS